MPHDKNGVELKPGDKVTVEMTVEKVYPTAETCNTQLVRSEPGEQHLSLACQAKQTVKVTMALLALLLFAGSVQAQEIDWNFRLTALEARVTALEAKANAPQAIQTAPRVIPPGFHAHTRLDGTTIVHADTNLGDPVAHAGIAYPWVKTGFAGQAVYASPVMMAPTYTRSRTVSVSAFSEGGCPGGVCPSGFGSVRRFFRGW